MGSPEVTLRRVLEPDDPSLPVLSRLLEATFADPDTVLELDRVQAFLGERRSQADRQFCVLVAEQHRGVLGGSFFSYVPGANCGFSEYLVVRKDYRGHGIGQRLVDARRSVLDELAREHGHAACRGVFIEVDNPTRTPADLLARERDTAMDAHVRLRVFAHLGFRRVAIDYVQPPLGPGKQPVSYLDLLFAAWENPARQQVPAGWVTQTLSAIWQSWSPTTAANACAQLRHRVGESSIELALLRDAS